LAVGIADGRLNGLCSGLSKARFSRNAYRDIAKYNRFGFTYIPGPGGALCDFVFSSGFSNGDKPVIAAFKQPVLNRAVLFKFD